MASNAEDDDPEARAWQRLFGELRRAARAGLVAAQCEARAGRTPTILGETQWRLAERHRRIEHRHLACARLYLQHADQLRQWRTGPRGAVPPVLMAAVAAELDVDSATLTLFDRRRSEIMIAASDRRSEAAHDIELSLGDGPARAAVAAQRPVLACGAELTDRWPMFGPAVADLGINAVVAVPLPGTDPHTTGALCAFGARPHLDDATASAAVLLADALANTILVDAADPGLGLPHPASDEADALALVHRAVGMIAAEHRCPADTALALMRARSFVTGEHLPALARRILDGDDLR
ncbi:ANTAR domain-containing protein [Nocardia blacklockiae]|uniref:ANTAR domain-containing protein n=1 Tax=Nocardia blacklockiae TaxID=480036 RepID=UPI001894463B|nr:ANTAR domain-containing protein [Nocardia blacklockiae]MBF6170347.1 GAF and ANTAR domain-containing protein [Nocardia blacklockiae]